MKTTFTHYYVCQPIDRCSETDHSYACQNGGTCLVDDTGQLTCKCHLKYTGEKCEIGKKTKITININQCFNKTSFKYQTPLYKYNRSCQINALVILRTIV